MNEITVLMSFFFLNKTVIAFKSKFSKVVMMYKAALDFGWCRKQAFIITFQNEKKRNIIKHVRGFFHSYFKKAGRPWVVKGRQCEVRVRYVRFISSYEGSSNVFFVLKLMKILRKPPVLFYPKSLFRHSYNFEKLQRTFFNRFKILKTKKQRIIILNDKQEQEINYYKYRQLWPQLKLRETSADDASLLEGWSTTNRNKKWIIKSMIYRY